MLARERLPAPAFIQAPPRCRSNYLPNGRPSRHRGGACFCVSVMRSPPSSARFDFENCIVLDDFGRLGRAYREVDERAADKATVLRQSRDSQFSKIRLAYAFNTAGG
jgi:hypothetical protein